MKGTYYRIRRTKTKDITYGDNREEGHVSYLERHPGTGRQYRFHDKPTICGYCLDHHKAIEFVSLSAARKKLRTAAVKEHFADERNCFVEYNRIEVVKITFKESAIRVIGLEMPEGHFSRATEIVVWPTPPVLDQLAAIL